MDALLRRVNDLFHEVDLLKLGVAELNARLESTLALSRLSLSQFEDVVRRQAEDREALAFSAVEPSDGEDLVG